MKNQNKIQHRFNIKNERDYVTEYYLSIRLVIPYQTTKFHRSARLFSILYIPHAKNGISKRNNKNQNILSKKTN